MPCPGHLARDHGHVPARDEVMQATWRYQPPGTSRLSASYPPSRRPRTSTLPSAGRPPQAAVRRAGLEGVEKSLPAPSAARTRRSGMPACSCTCVPLPRCAGRAGYRSWLRVVLVAVARRRLGLSSSATTSTCAWRLPTFHPKRGMTGGLPVAHVGGAQKWSPMSEPAPVENRAQRGGEVDPAALGDRP